MIAILIIAAVAAVAVAGLGIWWAATDRSTADRLDRLAFYGLIRRIDDVPVVTGHVVEHDPDTDLVDALEAAWNDEEATS